MTTQASTAAIVIRMYTHVYRIEMSDDQCHAMARALVDAITAADSARRDQIDAASSAAIAHVQQHQIAMTADQAETVADQVVVAPDRPALGN
jgi:hypothetical protein